METKNAIPLNKAIREAIEFGFRERFVIRNNHIRGLSSNKDFSSTEFAVAESYPVILENGKKGHINYIVLNNGGLGFLVDEIKIINTSQKHTEEELDSIELILENIYSA
ncbi:MAG TPA: hypothetical protein VNZ49_10485 [Bacteroidia bacterium]|jgi:hypothetical protein|nr:hypothetical protein [Bacteroidia bacterium]